MSHFGENTEITFSTGSSFGKPYINLNLQGEQFDPIDKDDEFGEVSTRLFAGLGLYPTYSYNKNTNKNHASFFRSADKLYYANTIKYGVVGIEIIVCKDQGNINLYFKQKALLDTFLEHHAISQAQYDKSLHDLTEKMNVTELR